MIATRYTALGLSTPDDGICLRSLPFTARSTKSPKICLSNFHQCNHHVLTLVHRPNEETHSSISCAIFQTSPTAKNRSSTNHVDQIHSTPFPRLISFHDISFEKPSLTTTAADSFGPNLIHSKNSETPCFIFFFSNLPLPAHTSQSESHFNNPSPNLPLVPKPPGGARYFVFEVRKSINMFRRSGQAGLQKRRSIPLEKRTEKHDHGQEKKVFPSLLGPFELVFLEIKCCKGE